MPTLLLVSLLGLVAGALVNYLADILPARRKLTRPFCRGCESPFPFWNYFVWPRRCPNCTRPRPLRTWLVEAAAVAIALALWLDPPRRLGFSLAIILLVYFGLVVVIDLEHRLILHPVSLVGAALGLGIGGWLHGLKSTLLGGLAGFGLMLFLYVAGVFLVRAMGRWRGLDGEGEAIGFGDVALGGVIGLLLGWPGVVGGLVLAIILGGAVSLVYLTTMILLRRYHPNLALPYGPVLAASAVILLLFPDVFLALLGFFPG